MAPVATISTRREVRRLLDADGGVLAELADDQVRGESTTAGVTPVEWREWELELVAADKDLLDSAARLFAASGAPPSTSRRELNAVLGAARLGPDRKPRPIGRSKPAERVLAHRIAEQVEELLAADFAVRSNHGEGVHRMRKACRRLRSALATYRPLVDRSLTDPARDELRWLARSLGDARDAQVVFGRLEDLVIGLPPGEVVGPVLRRVRTTSRVRVARHGLTFSTYSAHRVTSRCFVRWRSSCSTRPGVRRPSVLPPRLCPHGSARTGSACDAGTHGP